VTLHPGSGDYLALGPNPKEVAVGFQDEVVNAIRQIMPADAEIQVVNLTLGFYVGVSWRLNDDPERPNKMSKTISINVSHEAAQDFTSALEHDQADAYRRLNRFLSKNLANFDPRHNAPRHESPPVEQWFIDTNLLFG
jgi:hypothetical protein